jgi:predicted nucleic acid-binding protein
MGQQVTIIKGALLYLDTNVLIRMTEGSESERAVIHQGLQPFVAQGAGFVTSELTFTEVLVHPIRNGNQALIEAYNRLLTEFVEPHPVVREVLLLAAKLRADSPALRTPDAIHVATATFTGAHVFVTGDKGIKQLPDSMQLITV